MNDLIGEIDEYGIPLDKPWRDVRMYENHDENLQPIGKPLNLMDWQAKLQSELGFARVKIRTLETALKIAEAELAKRKTVGQEDFDRYQEAQNKVEVLITQNNKLKDESRNAKKREAELREAL